ncbi:MULTISPECIES: ATP-binding protein [unclassified Microcoleus]|uniref:ATP-binding protein n=1 Tax=unclassified Microcoleus TaxID=2642155 RepID=UPI002FCEF67D
MDKKQSASDESQVSRIKSAMVLYQLERTLGSFVAEEKEDPTELPTGTLKSIQERELKAGRPFDDSTTTGIIAASYLDEVLRMAVDAAKGRPEEEYLKKLRTLCEVLEVFNIRNAISHPNRPFHPCYWYRVATIATDPSIDQIQFREVTKAFLAAQAGQLVQPPDDWINAPIWSLPNNLPQEFEHDITGLKGRKKELEDLLEEIRNERNLLIAVVAPGGLGKTALVLSALQGIVSSPQSAEWVDQILYFSSKTEVLTSDGIVTQIPPAANIEGLRDSIARTLDDDEGLADLEFDKACQRFKSSRILLCFDNLETILRDSASAFDSFYRSLPREWRVIVTSRISVNSATSFPLLPLSSKGALELARSYLQKCGGERLSQDVLQNIVQASDSNPLAIRLTLDRFIAGRPLNEILLETKQQVLEFSYKNLIDALSPIAHEVLECLFVTAEPISRGKACDLIQRNLDEIAEAFTQLGRTSLVTRISSLTEESYNLSSSVRDLLLYSPVNTDVRTAVQEKLRKTKQSVSEIDKLQRDQQISPLFWGYVPENAPDQVRVVSTDAIRLLSRYSQQRGRLLTQNERRSLTDQLDKVKQAINRYQDQSVLHRIQGLILLNLQDRAQGKRALRTAWEMEPSDIASGLRLSLELRTDKEFLEAKNVAERLMDDGWDKPNRSNAVLARNVVQNYFLPLIWLGETEKVIEATNQWKSGNELRGILGSLRSQALRQSVAYEQSDLESVEKALLGAVDVLSDVLALDGYVGVFVAEGMKLLEQLVYATKYKQGLSKEAKFKFTTFVDEHLVSMCQGHKTLKLDSPDVLQWVKELSELSIEGRQNPLTAGRLNLLWTTNGTELNTEIKLDSNWLCVSVYYRPTADGNGIHKPFLFAKSKENQQYQVRSNKMDSADKVWETIQVGDELEILPDEKALLKEGQARPVLNARLLRR